MENTIVPALIIDDHSFISADEFHKQFCVWLEEKGVLAELRSYFRTNMIEILKNTVVGYSVTNKARRPISPKTHAINLLISEYMLHRQHHFSLCVFCAEVSLKHIFKTDAKAENWKFLQHDVADILESLGILRNSEYAASVSSEYYKSNDTLLGCLLCFNAINFFNVESHANVEFDEFDMKNIENLLNRTVSSENISKIKRYIKHICDDERENACKMIRQERNECKKLLKNYKTKLDGLIKHFDDERAKLEGEISDVRIIVEKKLDKKITHDAKRKTVELHETKVEKNALIAVIDQLQEENDTLKRLNRNYLDQIEELGHRAVLLMNELDNSQQRIARLSGLIENSETPSRRTVSYTGAGEQSFQRTTPIFRQKSYRHLTREKKKRSFDRSSPSTSSEGSELTDDVLKEAKDKLRNLELESNRIEEHYANDGVIEINASAMRLQPLAEGINYVEPDFRNNQSSFDTNQSTHLPVMNGTTRRKTEGTDTKNYFPGHTFSFLDYFKANSSSGVNLKAPISNERSSNLRVSTRTSETTSLDID